MEVSAKFTGFDRVSVPWHEVKRVLPGATSAFESPAHDVLYVVQDKWLYELIPAQQQARCALLTTRLDGRPVMSQWAMGAHAARWSKEAGALLKE